MKKSKLFNAFYIRYFDKLEDGVSKSDCFKKNGHHRSIYDSLYNELFSLTYMTLVYELNNLRDRDKLIGETSEERYLFFENMIRSVTFFGYMQEKYPVLIDLMNSVLEHYIKSVNKIVDAFCVDSQALSEKFGREFNYIDDIQIGMGDAHKVGDSVAIITGNFGKLVYKPNGLINDRIFNELIDIVNPYLLLKLNKVEVLQGENYGWQEFIEHTECENEIKVQSFYRRLGYHLSLFYVLNSCDLHYENIIASGEHPCVIDLETLITTSVGTSNKNETLYNLLQDNVLRSGLLPVRTQDSYIDTDLSGFSGGEVTGAKHETYQIINIGTDQMVVRKKMIEEQEKISHKPFIKDKNINIIDYIVDLIDGFKESMKILQNNKEKLLIWIRSNSFKESSYRQVLRPTYVYGEILSSSNYPSYLVSFEERKKLLNRLINQEENEKSRDETSILLKGLIPAYECQYVSKDLYRNKKLIKKDFFSESPQEVAERKICSLSEKTTEFQVKLIECSMLTILKNPVVQDDEIQLENTGLISLEESLETIYREIMSYEVRLSDDSMSDLFQTRIIGEKYMLSGSNFSLYEGGGLIWSLYCYGLYTGDDSIQALAIRLLKKADMNYNKLKAKLTGSAFSDTAGAIYLYYNFYISTQNEEYYLSYKNYLKKYLIEIKQSSEIDYVNGVSGAIHLLSNLYKKNKDKDLYDLLIVASNKLQELIENKLPQSFGIAHGQVGISIALMDCYEITANDRYLEQARDLLLADNLYSDMDNKSWCNGVGGVVLAYANILNRDTLDATTYQQIVIKFHKYVEKYLHLDKRINIGLCHGSSGELEVLNSLFSTYKHLLSQDELVMIISRIQELSERVPITNGNNLGVPLGLTLDTFMMGASGVAYTQLRMMNSEFPSIMMFEVIEESVSQPVGVNNDICCKAG